MNAGAWGYFTQSTTALNTSDLDLRLGGASSFVGTWPTVLDDSATRKMMVVNTSVSNVVRQALADAAANSNTSRFAIAFKLLQS